MKKILCILLCTCMLIPLAACGGEKEKKSGDYLESVSMTVATKGQVGVVFEKTERETDSFYGTTETQNVSFLAYDKDGILYRILDGNFDRLKAGEEIIVTYDPSVGSPIRKIEEDAVKEGMKIEYELDPYFVWTKWEWELKKTADRLVQDECGLPLSYLKSSYRSDQNGNYKFSYAVTLNGVDTGEDHRLVLTNSGKLKETDCDEDKYSRYIGTDIEKAIPAAKAKIQAECGEEDPHFYFEIDEESGYVYLCTEVIVNLTPDHPDYGQGCGNHIHHMYREKLGKA